MRKLFTATVLLVLVLSLNGFSQSNNATLGGTVQDVTGAFIPGVTITATNSGTGIVTTVISNEAGAYQFASLQPGTYDVKADLAGFQPAVAKSFQLGGAQQARFNFTLQVGGAATTVDVNIAADTLLATSSNSIGTVLPEYKVRDLPLAVRDVFGLVASTAGVQGDGNLIGNFAGGRLSAANTMRDGINVSAGRFEDGAWSLTYTSPDLVEEVKVVVAPVDAQTSRGNGQVSMVTRSGTNDFHGTVFWANHNSALDANSWFNNFNGVAKNYDNRSQFGARVSGPIVKRKTFFMVLFEGQRDLKRENATGNTLTPMARQGIFRYFPGVDNANANNANPTVDRSGNPVRPARATGDLAAIDLFGNCAFQGAPVANCRAYRDPLRSGISNTAYIQETLRRMPLPNEYTGPNSVDGLNVASIRFTRRVEGLDFTLGNGPDVDRDQYNARIDHQFNANHKLSVIGTREKTWGAATQAILRSWPEGFDGQAVRRPDVYIITFTSTLSSTLLNEFRAGRRRSIDQQFPPANRSGAIGEEALKFIPEVNGVRYHVVPTLWAPFVQYGRFGAWRNHESPMYSIGDDLSWTYGKHAFKGGFEFRNTMSRGFGDPGFTPFVTIGQGSASPVSGLDGTVYAGLTANSTTAARDLLTHLSGSVDRINQSFGIMNAKNLNLTSSPAMPYKYYQMHQREISAYFKDDWKFRPDLTLNLGAHWEYYGQPFEHNGIAARIIGDDESALTNITCTSSPGTANFRSACSNLTQVQFVGRNSPNPEKLVNLKGNDLNNWGPAVGIAWNLPWFGKGKTVLRTGYGVTYQGALRNFITVDSTVGTLPGINLVGAGGTGVTYNPPTYTSLASVTLPVPLPPGTPTTVPFTIPTTDRTLSINTYNRVSPYTQNWNLEIQRELARNTTVEIRYIGTKGTKLWGTLNLNQLDALHRNKELFDAFNAARSGGESALLNQMLLGTNLGGTGAQAVNGTTWTGAMAIRANTTTRGQVANGTVGQFLNTLQTLNTGAPATGNGAVMRRNGFPENYLVANPQFNQIAMLNNLGNSTYHSMQLQFTRRLTGGFTNTTTWTWSKALGDSDGDGGASYRDPTNRSIEKSLLGFDRAHQLTSNGTYELPFGLGHRILGSAPGWVQQVVNKWQLGGIMNYNSGAPLTITSTTQTISNVNALPNIVGSLPDNMGKVTKVSNGVVFFDGFTQTTDPGINGVTTLNGLRTAYSNRAIVDPSGNIVLVNPQPGEVGTLGLTTIKGPRNLSFDMNLIKRFKIHESREFEFRLDAINILNHPNFGNPSMNITASLLLRADKGKGQRAEKSR
ncbi:MAG: carboxypeptidase regulatory-like domain-containing protein [Acidobacteria bacterium]|nr:carboxypeptidase regulatory-like domain-containing protein [Acidobacteriota bacterium]